jgi:hypothetical protein
MGKIAKIRPSPLLAHTLSSNRGIEEMGEIAKIRPSSLLAKRE